MEAVSISSINLNLEDWMNKLVLASRNQHKIEEMRALLQPLGIEVLSALDFPGLKEVEEDQLTLEGNAIKKATYKRLHK